MKVFAKIPFLIAAFLPSSLLAMPGADRAEIKKVMTGIFSTMTELLPMSLSETEFFAAENEAKIKAKLDLLDSQLGNLQTVSLDQSESGFRVNRDNFIKDVRLAAQAFAKGTKRHAQFRINESMEYCIGCHSLRESQNDSAVSLDPFKKFDKSVLGELATAKFLTMSRHFSEALTEYERILGSVGLSLEDKINSNPYKNYVLLAVRVKDEPKRAADFFTKLIVTEDSAIIRLNLKKWIESLKDIQQPIKGTNTELAQNLMKKGEALSRYPADKAGLIYFARASLYLRNELDHLKDGSNAAERSQLFYLLGKSELGIEEDNYKALTYFEDAIRAWPGSDLAAESYALYEENLVLGYTGSLGTFVPEEEKVLMAELKSLSKVKNTDLKN